MLIYALTGSFDYNGAGTDIIKKAFIGQSRPEAFILKMLLTALTLGCGFKGGEIVPSLYIGATFGCFSAACWDFPTPSGLLWDWLRFSAVLPTAPLQRSC